LVIGADDPWFGASLLAQRISEKMGFPIGDNLIAREPATHDP
jgi:hypothetical protein